MKEKIENQMIEIQNERLNEIDRKSDKYDNGNCNSFTYLVETPKQIENKRYSLSLKKNKRENKIIKIDDNFEE